MPVQIGEGQAAIPKWQFYPTELGRDVYNKRSITAQARSTVSDLIGLIIAGAQYEGKLPFKLREVTERLIVDGPVVIDDPGGRNKFIDDCYAPSKETLYIYHRDDNGVMKLLLPNNDMHRAYTEQLSEYKLVNGTWSEKIIKNFGDPQQRTELTRSEVTPAPVEIDVAKLFVFPNGRGELYWGQHPFHAVDEIAETMRNVGSGINLLPIISGNVGGAEQAARAIREAINAIIFPGGVTVDRVVSDAIVGQLLRESDALRGYFKDAMNAIEKDGANRPVAADRELRMRATTEFVRTTRTSLVEIYDAHNVSLGFDHFVVKGGEERLRDLDIIDRVRARSSITDEEAKKQERALVGLGLRDTPAKA